MMVQTNLVPSPSEAGRKQQKNLPGLALLSFLPLTTAILQPFLGCHFGFHNFFTLHIFI